MSMWIEERDGVHVVVKPLGNAEQSGATQIVAKGTLEFCQKRAGKHVAAVPAAAVSSNEATATVRPAVTPAARKLADKFGIDPETLQPGPNGKVGVSEVRAAR